MRTQSAYRIRQIFQSISADSVKALRRQDTQRLRVKDCADRTGACAHLCQDTCRSLAGSRRRPAMEIRAFCWLALRSARQRSETEAMEARVGYLWIGQGLPFKPSNAVLADWDREVLLCRVVTQVVRVNQTALKCERLPKSGLEVLSCPRKDSRSWTDVCRSLQWRLRAVSSFLGPVRCLPLLLWISALAHRKFRWRL